jgi:hypothetical protein
MTYYSSIVKKLEIASGTKFQRVLGGMKNLKTYQHGNINSCFLSTSQTIKE